jgi:hypothetical protein
MTSTQGRRSFMSVIASLTGALAVDGQFARAFAQTPARAAGPQFDLTWIDQFKGQHKQVFDYGSFDLSADARPLRFVRNYLDPYRDVFGLQGPEINTAVGISRPAFPINASDAIWQKYRLGERWKITDPTTKQPAVRNIYLSDGDASIKALQARGTVFWQCNVALGAIVTELAEAVKMPAAEVRAELIAGFVPGVRLVPSHVLAVGLVQEKGFTYFQP